MSPGKDVSGLVAATFTPFTTQGEINLSVIESYVDYLVEQQGVNSVFLNGTTGEGISMTVQERKNVTEEWCLRGKPKLEQVIVHVGCMSLKDSQELARHAQAVGADAIAVITPSFHKPTNADAMKMFLQQVAEAAPSLPLYYYHIPAVTGVDLEAWTVLEGIEKQVPSFRGIKFSSSNLRDLGQCILYCTRHNWTILYGVDEQLLGALAFGVRGAVGSTYNYIGRRLNRMLSAFDGADLDQARNIQLEMQDILTFALGNGFNLAMNKQLMCEVSGLPLGPPRLPLLPCPPSQAQPVAERVRKFLKEQ